MKHKVIISTGIIILIFSVLVVSACSSNTTTTTNQPSTTTTTTTSVNTSTNPSTTVSTTSKPTTSTATTPVPTTTSKPTTTATSSSTPATTSNFKMELSWATAGSVSMATYTKFLKVYQDELTKRTNGRITFKTYASESLLKQPDQYDGLIKGICDMSYAVHSATPGRFPAWEVFNLPLIAADTVEGANQVLRQMLGEFPELQKEHSEVKLIDVFGTLAYQIHTTKKPVRTFADLKGLKIGGPSSSTVFPAVTGVIPVQIGAGDMYGALDKGVVDGVVLPWGVLTAFGLNELTKYHTICNIGSASQWMAMNLDTWNKLPPDIQQIFDGIKAGDYWPGAVAAQTQTSIDVANKLGYETINLSQGELSKWYDAMTPTWDKWVTEKEAQGISSARAILDRAVELVKEVNAK